MAYTDNEIKDSIKRVEKFIKTNKRRPQTIKVGKSTLTIAQYLNDLKVMKNARTSIKNFRDVKGRYPNYVTIAGYQLTKEYYKILWNISNKVDNNLPDTATPTPTPSTKDEVYEYFCKKCGKRPQTIDEALKIVDGKGYGYYYNDKFSNKQTIDNIFKKGASKPNCTDSCHVFYHIGKVLGYEVRGVHVKCKGGDGHIRLQFKHPVNTGGKWINRDPACVLSNNGKPITSNWCLDGTVLAYDPQWFKIDLNR